MKFEVITLFPDYFRQPLGQSLVGKGLEKELFEISITNLRDFAVDRHRTVDDRPFGGSAGMVLMIEPLDRCLRHLGYRRPGGEPPHHKDRIILTSAAGYRLDQNSAKRLSLCDRVTIVCGHYLGVDERLLQLYEVEEVSLGDYTLTGGEPAALVMIDAIARLLPGVLGDFESALGDSHMEGRLGSPHYTRPAEYEGLHVPAVLVSGNHKMINEYRRAAALKKCLQNRPDLLGEDQLSREERELLNKYERDSS